MIYAKTTELFIFFKAEFGKLRSHFDCFEQSLRSLKTRKLFYFYEIIKTDDSSIHPMAKRETISMIYSKTTELFNFFRAEFGELRFRLWLF